jgi:hypothetical protein
MPVRRNRHLRTLSPTNPGYHILKAQFPVPGEVTDDGKQTQASQPWTEHKIPLDWTKDTETAGVFLKRIYDYFNITECRLVWSGKLFAIGETAWNQVLIGPDTPMMSVNPGCRGGYPPMLLIPAAEPTTEAKPTTQQL